MKRGETILVTGATGTVTIIGLAGIVLVAVASLLVQSASAISHVMAETVKVEQEQPEYQNKGIGTKLIDR
jgi:p-aminobenzoyl-glutamate transporter AbgT